MRRDSIRESIHSSRVVSLLDIFESWEQAEFAAEKADYFFSLLE